MVPSIGMQGLINIDYYKIFPLTFMQNSLNIRSLCHFCCCFGDGNDNDKNDDVEEIHDVGDNENCNDYKSAVDDDDAVDEGYYVVVSSFYKLTRIKK
ncbi:hypothetical protein Ahia01_000267400 [Argonauta hians]